jgi:hypothetical protein
LNYAYFIVLADLLSPFSSPHVWVRWLQSSISTIQLDAAGLYVRGDRFFGFLSMEPKLLLIVTATAGLIVRDTPRPESKGGKALRKVPVGSQLYAYDTHFFDNVEYARLVPINPQRPEWVRVAEADGATEYVQKIELEPTKDSTSSLADAVTLLATAIRELARKT